MSATEHNKTRAGTAGQDEILLDVRHLRTEFITEEKEVTAVNDVSFQVRKRETFGLIGESGCGKSVTCRSLLQILKYPGQVTGGEVLFQGKDLRKCSAREMENIRGRQISMIFQEPMTTLNPVETIGKQIMETFKEKLSREEQEERAIHLMELVGIPSPKERLDAYPHQFSGGMRQRAMIAIALASRPALLLADEPTTALDVTVQEQIIRLLRSVQKEMGMSVIMVTHDLGVASEICSRIAVMYAGRIMEIAPTRELFSNPMNPYTYGLLRSIPSLARKGEPLYSIEGTPPALDEMPAGCPFAPRCEFCREACRSRVPELQECGQEHYSRCFCMDRLLAARRAAAGELDRF